MEASERFVTGLSMLLVPLLLLVGFIIHPPELGAAPKRK